MDISSIGPAGLDPFTPTSGPPADEVSSAPSDASARDAAPLPEGSGTVIDTTA